MDEFKEKMRRNWVEVVYAIAAVLMVGYAIDVTSWRITDILTYFE